MSSRAARRIVWLALLFLVPLPLLPMLGFVAWVPVARYVLLGGICLWMRLAEGPGGAVWQLTALFLGHAFVYALLLWALAWLGARGLARLPSAGRAALLAAGVVAGVLWAVATTPYVTPFGASARTNLPGVLR